MDVYGGYGVNIEDLVGQTVGRYHVESLLDPGVGQVLRGVDPVLSRPVAIKVMQHLASNDTLRMRFLQVSRAAAVLKHPNIIEIYDFGGQDDFLYQVMEFVPDGSLHSWLRRQSAGPCPLTLGLDLVCQAAEGLEAAHVAGMVHCDIKPDNLLLARLNGPVERYQVKITDFGVARLGQGDLVVMTNAPVSAVAYMSPEQCRGESVDRCTDVYALGMVLYEVVTGALPFQIDNYHDGLHKQQHMELRSPRLVRPDLPARMEEVILRCLAKNPRERFQSCKDLAHVLTQLSRERDIASMPLPLVPAVSSKQALPKQPSSTKATESQVLETLGYIVEPSSEFLEAMVSSSVVAVSGHEKKVSVLSQDMGKYTNVDASVSVPGQFAQVQDALRLEPQRARGRGNATYTLTLRNAGNAPESYSLRGDDQKQKLTYRFGTERVELGEGQETAVRLSVKAKKRFIGREQHHFFRVYARPASDAAEQVCMGEFINRALISI